VSEAAFAGRCWGGPAEGEWIAGDRSTLVVAEFGNPRHYTWREPIEVATPLNIRKRHYTWREVGFGPMVFGLWMIDGPRERVEALERDILEGLHATWVWTMIATA
jgi:hypothetical protein